MTEEDLLILVLEALHSGPDGFRSVVRDLAASHPATPARRLEAALQSAAREMDATIRRDGSPTNEARTARRLAVLLGMDIDRTGDNVTLGELMEWWKGTDDFFMRL
ncbi:hypothetical protein [Jannaschia rubra]|uniref:Uncharacterized protein n=1 Tax=Jannaschia rubra TaxID=282197 RepID=A0A0M6XQU4_9RHOB|nr:hypothetical protein [Jannaschia rubra]CTQ32384.1 hypothetical protein JAN5088_01149 [Jannaschia rubra]SFG45664.1 hypothetical protein SAMN04488517_10555 [Jannaschia rubra]